MTDVGMYHIRSLPRANRAIAKLPGRAYDRVIEAIGTLALNPRPSGCSKLRGRDAWRIRVGDYRIIYDIGDAQSVVTILHVGHRKEVYR